MGRKTTTIEPYIGTAGGALHGCDGSDDHTDPPDLDDPVYDGLNPGVADLERRLIEAFAE